jgi:hypothetical protein
MIAGFQFKIRSCIFLNMRQENFSGNAQSKKFKSATLSIDLFSIFAQYMPYYLVPSYLESSSNWDTNAIFIRKMEESCETDTFTCCVTILISINSFLQATNTFM